MNDTQAQILIDQLNKLEEISAFLLDEGMVVQSETIDNIVHEMVDDLVELYGFKPAELAAMGGHWFE